jgi:hypothetical protein
MIRTLYYIQAAFSVWMLVDAIRRRSDFYWYIVVFVPFGPLAYFLAVKIHDYDLRWLKQLVNVEHRPSVDALRFEYRQTPSFANRMRLAAGLHDAGLFAEAAELFEEALAIDESDLEALHGLGRCRLELGEPEQAVEPLSALFQRRSSYRDFAAAVDLARALTDTARDEEAIDVLEVVTRASPQVPHFLLLGQRLAAVGRNQRARDVLSYALEGFERAPLSVRWRDRSAARDARALLESLPPS